MAAERRWLDLEMRDLSEEHVDACARLHRLCFPEKLESLLGHACITDCLRTRYMPPVGDAYCRVALVRETGQLVGYCYAESIAHGELAHAFLSPALARKHLLRTGWRRPAVWSWLINRVWRRLISHGGRVREPEANRALGGEVAKMLAVHPDARGTNVGRDLMVDNELEARRRGARRLLGRVLRGNVKAERLYASIGWVRSLPDSQHDEVFAMHKELRDDNVLSFTPRPDVPAAMPTGAIGGGERTVA